MNMKLFSEIRNDCLDIGICLDIVVAVLINSNEWKLLFVLNMEILLAKFPLYLQIIIGIFI